MDINNEIGIAVTTATEEQAIAISSAIRYGLDAAGFENVGHCVMSETEEDQELQYEAPPTMEDLDRTMGTLRDDVPNLQIELVAVYEQISTKDE